MKKVMNRIILIIGMLITITGYVLNRLVSRYQGLYRSLQYRNMKLEASLFTAESKGIALILIGLLVLASLGYWVIRNRQALKQKGIGFFGAFICGGQAVNVLSGDSSQQMGLYVVFFGYMFMFIGFALSLCEKDSGSREI